MTLSDKTLMPLHDKTLEQIVDETLSDLIKEGIESTPGDLVRIMLAVINKQMGTYYDIARENFLQAFVSTATGPRLEAVGMIVQCEKRDGEGDDNYRYRISKQIESMAAGNYMAVRLAALSVGGVQDVKMKPYSHGTGSFSVYVVSAETYTPDELLEDVRAAVESIKSLGVRSNIYRPIIKETEVKIRVIFDKSVSEKEKDIYLDTITGEIQDYLNGLNVGDMLDYSQFESIARSSCEYVKEVNVFDLRINGRSVIPRDIIPAWNERFVESTKQNAVLVI